jgi:hypothetical protein
MVTIVSEKWGRINRRVVVIIVSKFRHQQQICPIILLVRAEHPKVRFHPLVVILDLTLSLWVICCRKSQLDSEVLIDTLCEVGCERRTMIRPVHKGNPMQFPDMANVQLHQIRSRNICCCQNEMCHLCESIGDDIDGVKPIRFWQFTHKVRLDPLPWTIWSRDQLQFSVFVLVPMLRSPASVTTLYVSLNPVGKILMPITLRHKFQCARSA